jgi:transcriptional regulator with XRE-family HTH domain
VTSPLTARSQQIWAAAINEAEPDRRRVAAAVGVTTRMLGRYLGGSSEVDADLARRIAEAAGLVVVPVTDTGFIMTKKPDRFDPGLHAHATFTVVLVPLAVPYPANKARVFGDLLELRGDQPNPPDESQQSAYPAKWPEDDLRIAAVALADELERRGRHEDSEQLARLVLGLAERPNAVEPSVLLERGKGVLAGAGFKFLGVGLWARTGVCEAISAWGGEIWVDSESAISTACLRALADVADRTERPHDEGLDESLPVGQLERPLVVRMHPRKDTN